MDKEMHIDDLLDTDALTYSDGLNEFDSFYDANTDSVRKHAERDDTHASSNGPDPSQPLDLHGASSDAGPFTHRAMQSGFWHAGSGEPLLDSHDFGATDHPWSMNSTSDPSLQTESSGAPWTGVQLPQSFAEPQQTDGGYDELPPRITHPHDHDRVADHATYPSANQPASPLVLNRPPMTSQSGASVTQSPSPVHWHSALEESQLEWIEDSDSLPPPAAPTSTEPYAATLQSQQLDFPKLDVSEEKGSVSPPPTRFDDDQSEQDKLDVPESPDNDTIQLSQERLRPSAATTSAPESSKDFTIEDASASKSSNAMIVESGKIVLPVTHPKTLEAALALDVSQHKDAVKPSTRVNVIDLGDSGEEYEEEEESTIASVMQDDYHTRAPPQTSIPTTPGVELSRVQTLESGVNGSTSRRLPPSSGNKSDLQAEMEKEDTAAESSKRESPVSTFKARLASTLERVDSPAERLSSKHQAASAMSAAKAPSESSFDGDSVHDSAVDDADETTSIPVSHSNRSLRSTARGKPSLLQLSRNQEQRLTNDDMAEIAQKVKSELAQETEMVAPTPRPTRLPSNLKSSPPALSPDKPALSPFPPVAGRPSTDREAKFLQNSGSPVAMPKKPKPGAKGKQKRGTNPRNLLASMVPAHLDNTGGSFTVPKADGEEEDSYPEPAKPPAKNLATTDPPQPASKRRAAPKKRDIEIMVALPEEEAAEERERAPKRRKTEPQAKAKSHISRDLMDIVGDSVMGNLHKPRQTRGQKKEQDANAPNAGAAAKKRHTKDGKLIVG